jgi:hypothetical protein
MITATSQRRLATTAVRMVLTLVGAALAVAGAFMQWVDHIVGTNLSWKAFYMTQWTSSKNFFTTVGAVFILLGLLGVIGLADQTAWLTRIAGALGIVGFALIAIEIFRAHSQISALGDRLEVGAWIGLVGSVVLVIAGFFGAAGTTVVSD